MNRDATTESLGFKQQKLFFFKKKTADVRCSLSKKKSWGLPTSIGVQAVNHHLLLILKCHQEPSGTVGFDCLSIGSSDLLILGGIQPWTKIYKNDVYSVLPRKIYGSDSAKLEASANEKIQKWSVHQLRRGVVTSMGCKPSKTEAAPSKMESKLETDKIKDFKELGSWVNMEVTSVAQTHWEVFTSVNGGETPQEWSWKTKQQMLDLTQQKSWFKAFDNIKNGGFRNAKWV